MTTTTSTAAEMALVDATSATASTAASLLRCAHGVVDALNDGPRLMARSDATGGGAENVGGSGSAPFHGVAKLHSRG